MKRFTEDQLTSWLQKPRRKPLIIRGARQVGKSTLVRNFAEAQGLILAEINLERHGNIDEIFKSNDLGLILPELEVLSKTSLRQENTLLFLDEIQSTPHAFEALRYFYEDAPDLPVIAAGSLLEFVLDDHDFSMPVGRVEDLHLGPMTFTEFLLATEDERLLAHVEDFQLNLPLPQTAHQKLLLRQRQYLFIGGMPESILSYLESGGMLGAREVHRSIIQTYKDDFTKYSHEPTLGRIHMVFDAIPQIVGEKVKYTNISRDHRSKDLRQAIDLLIKARLLLPAYHSHCTGIPIRSGINDKFYKLFFLDVGLLNYLYGLEWSQISALDERSLLNEGVLAEQFIAQHLAYRFNGLEPPDLFYWLREGKSANAEIDFVTSVGRTIIPIEVKAGKSGSIKSLQQFVIEKDSILTCRFDLNLPSLQDLSYQTRQKQQIQKVKYKLVSLPLYMVEVLHKILAEVLDS